VLFLDSLRALIPVLAVVWHVSGGQVNLSALVLTLQAVIHCEIVRQAARVIAMDKERLRSGDRACVRFRFLQRPEYLTAGTRLVFREGKTKGIGMVVGTE